ncbi:hypothetical protein BJX76DRAFT_19257 [Aspergillus varians]
MAGSPTSKNLIAVVIGAVLLFGAISVTPIVIMRRHRRRAAERHANELGHLEVNGSMRQVSVQRWLDQQSTADNLERYAGESCPICLTSLLAPSALSSLSLSGSTMHTLNPNPNQPQPPAPAHISHQHPDRCSPPTNNDDDNCRSSSNSNSNNNSRPPPVPISHETERRSNPGGGSISGVLILNRCNHAFHKTCLASWFQYRQYRCPICSDMLFSE